MNTSNMSGPSAQNERYVALILSATYCSKRALQPNTYYIPHSHRPRERTEPGGRQVHFLFYDALRVRSFAHSMSPKRAAECGDVYRTVHLPLVLSGESPGAMSKGQPRVPGLCPQPRMLLRAPTQTGSCESRRIDRSAGGPATNAFLPRPANRAVEVAPCGPFRARPTP